MNMVTAIEPVTKLKTRSAQLIRNARDSGQPIVITQNGRATAVLQDVETYEEQRRALLLLRLMAQGDRELRQGMVISHAAARKHFEKKLKDLRDA